MSQPFRKHQGKVAPLLRANIDTDQIIPKQFLKRIERTGFGEFLFHDWRKALDGRVDPDFVLNQPRYQGASILLAGKNFGCGSSREHAVWALADFGFRAVIAPSFADIFSSNCVKNGVLTVRLSESESERIRRLASEIPGYKLTIDLEEMTVFDGGDFHARFELDDFTRRCLLEGLDDIGLTLEHAAEIARYEAQHAVPQAWKA